MNILKTLQRARDAATQEGDLATQWAISMAITVHIRAGAGCLAQELAFCKEYLPERMLKGF